MHPWISNMESILLVSWIKIATRDLLPELAGARLTPKLCSRVAEAFVSKYGAYAGWAQTLLFIAELPSQKALLPSHFSDVEEKKSVKRKKQWYMQSSDENSSPRFEGQIVCKPVMRSTIFEVPPSDSHKKFFNGKHCCKTIRIAEQQSYSILT